MFFEVTNTKGTGLQKKWEKLITGIKKEARTTEHFLFPCPMYFFLFPLSISFTNCHKFQSARKNH